MSRKDSYMKRASLDEDISYEYEDDETDFDPRLLSMRGSQTNPFHHSTHQTSRQSVTIPNQLQERPPVASEDDMIQYMPPMDRKKLFRSQKDEDMFALQDQFLRSGAAPSARIETVMKTISTNSTNESESFRTTSAYDKTTSSASAQSQAQIATAEAQGTNQIRSLRSQTFDTEDDVISYQQDFFTKGGVSSAKVVRAAKGDTLSLLISSREAKTKDAASSQPSLVLFESEAPPTSSSLRLASPRPLNQFTDETAKPATKESRFKSNMVQRGKNSAMSFKSSGSASDVTTQSASSSGIVERTRPARSTIPSLIPTSQSPLQSQPKSSLPPNPANDDDSDFEEMNPKAVLGGLTPVSTTHNFRKEGEAISADSQLAANTEAFLGNFSAMMNPTIVERKRSTNLRGVGAKPLAKSAGFPISERVGMEMANSDFRDDRYKRVTERPVFGVGMTADGSFGSNSKVVPVNRARIIPSPSMVTHSPSTNSTPNLTGIGKKKQSVFAMQAQKQKDNEANTETTTAVTRANTLANQEQDIQNMSVKSSSFTPSFERSFANGGLHTEALQDANTTFSQMSEVDILQAQSELLESLPPHIVEMFRKRKEMQPQAQAVISKPSSSYTTVEAIGKGDVSTTSVPVKKSVSFGTTSPSSDTGVRVMSVGSVRALVPNTSVADPTDPRYEDPSLRPDFVPSTMKEIRAAQKSAWMRPIAPAEDRLMGKKKIVPFEDISSLPVVTSSFSAKHKKSVEAEYGFIIQSGNTTGDHTEAVAGEVIRPDDVDEHNFDIYSDADLNVNLGMGLSGGISERPSIADTGVTSSLSLDWLNWRVDFDGLPFDGQSKRHYSFESQNGDRDEQRDDGNIGNIGNDSEIEVGSGLFHHGAQPGRPGYTLTEVLGLSRSTVVSQRALAAGILRKIVTNARRHIYTYKISANSAQAGTAPLVDYSHLVLSFLFVRGSLVGHVRQLLDDGAATVQAQALGLLLALLEPIPDCFSRVAEGEWNVEGIPSEQSLNAENVVALSCSTVSTSTAGFSVFTSRSLALTVEAEGEDEIEDSQGRRNTKVSSPWGDLEAIASPVYSSSSGSLPASALKPSLPPVFVSSHGPWAGPIPSLRAPVSDAMTMIEADFYGLDGHISTRPGPSSSVSSAALSLCMREEGVFERLAELRSNALSAGILIDEAYYLGLDQAVGDGNKSDSDGDEEIYGGMPEENDDTENSSEDLSILYDDEDEEYLLKAYRRHKQNENESQHHDDVVDAASMSLEQTSTFDVVAAFASMSLLPRLRFILFSQLQISDPEKGVNSTRVLSYSDSDLSRVNASLSVQLVTMQAFLSYTQHSPRAAVLVYFTPHLLEAFEQMLSSTVSAVDAVERYYASRLESVSSSDVAAKRTLTMALSKDRLQAAMADHTRALRNVCVMQVLALFANLEVGFAHDLRTRGLLSLSHRYVLMANSSDTTNQWTRCEGATPVALVLRVSSLELSIAALRLCTVIVRMGVEQPILTLFPALLHAIVLSGTSENEDVDGDSGKTDRKSKVPHTVPISASLGPLFSHVKNKALQQSRLAYSLLEGVLSVSTECLLEHMGASSQIGGETNTDKSENENGPKTPPISSRREKRVAQSPVSMSHIARVAELAMEFFDSFSDSETGLLLGLGASSSIIRAVKLNGPLSFLHLPLNSTASSSSPSASFVTTFIAGVLHFLATYYTLITIHPQFGSPALISSGQLFEEHKEHVRNAPGTIDVTNAETNGGRDVKDPSSDSTLNTSETVDTVAKHLTPILTQLSLFFNKHLRIRFEEGSDKNAIETVFIPFLSLFVLPGVLSSSLSDLSDDVSPMFTSQKTLLLAFLAEIVSEVAATESRLISPFVFPFPNIPSSPTSDVGVLLSLPSARLSLSLFHSRRILGAVSMPTLEATMIVRDILVQCLAPSPVNGDVVSAFTRLSRAYLDISSLALRHKVPISREETPTINFSLISDASSKSSMPSSITLTVANIALFAQAMTLTTNSFALLRDVIMRHQARPMETGALIARAVLSPFPLSNHTTMARWQTALSQQALGLAVDLLSLSPIVSEEMAKVEVISPLVYLSLALLSSTFHSGFLAVPSLLAYGEHLGAQNIIARVIANPLLHALFHAHSQYVRAAEYVDPNVPCFSDENVQQWLPQLSAVAQSVLPSTAVNPTDMLPVSPLKRASLHSSSILEHFFTAISTHVEGRAVPRPSPYTGPLRAAISTSLSATVADTLASTTSLFSLRSPDMFAVSRSFITSPDAIIANVIHEPVTPLPGTVKTTKNVATTKPYSSLPGVSVICSAVLGGSRFLSSAQGTSPAAGLSHLGWVFSPLHTLAKIINSQQAYSDARVSELQAERERLYPQRSKTLQKARGALLALAKDVELNISPNFSSLELRPREVYERCSMLAENPLFQREFVRMREEFIAAESEMELDAETLFAIRELKTASETHRKAQAVAMADVLTGMAHLSVLIRESQAGSYLAAYLTRCCKTTSTPRIVLYGDAGEKGNDVADAVAEVTCGGKIATASHSFHALLSSHAHKAALTVLSLGPDFSLSSSLSPFLGSLVFRVALSPHPSLSRLNFTLQPESTGGEVVNSCPRIDWAAPKHICSPYLHQLWDGSKYVIENRQGGTTSGKTGSGSRQLLHMISALSTQLYKTFAEAVEAFSRDAAGNPTHSALLLAYLSTHFPYDFRRKVWSDVGLTMPRALTVPDIPLYVPFEKKKNEEQREQKGKDIVPLESYSLSMYIFPQTTAKDLSYPVWVSPYLGIFVAKQETRGDLLSMYREALKGVRGYPPLTSKMNPILYWIAKTQVERDDYGTN